MKKILFLLLLPLSSSLLAQQKQGQARIDSLLAQLSKEAEDTNKVNTLADLCYTDRTINPDEGLKYGQKALDLGEKLSWKKGIALTDNDIGISYHNKLNYQLYSLNLAWHFLQLLQFTWASTILLMVNYVVTCTLYLKSL